MARILFVNDEGDLAAICAMVLEAAGHDVDTAVRGDDAVEIARARMPDLFILDWIIGDMNGGDLLGKLRSLPGGERVPALLITALMDGLERAHEFHFDDFLAKPFGREALVAAADRVLLVGLHEQRI